MDIHPRYELADDSIESNCGPKREGLKCERPDRFLSGLSPETVAAVSVSQPHVGVQSLKEYIVLPRAFPDKSREKGFVMRTYHDQDSDEFEIVFAMSFVHPKTKKRVFRKDGRPFCFKVKKKK